MPRHRYSWFVAFSLSAFLLHAGARTAAGQVRAAPGRGPVPGTSTQREAPLLNWSEVTAPEFCVGDCTPQPTGPFRIFRFESVEGSQHWVERSYHWLSGASGATVLDGTKVYPSGVRMVHAVTGYEHHLSGVCGWYGCPETSLALLIPIPSGGASRGVRRLGSPNDRADPAALQRIPLAQAMGYQSRPSAPVRQARTGACPASTEYEANGPRLQASCILLDPGQFVDLPNQTRILRVGENYRVMVRGTLVDDFQNVTIIRADADRYYALSVIR